MSEENSKKSSCGQIVALILTALLIVGLIVVNFVFSENRFVITSSIVFLTCLLVIVVLSKSFDSFSLGFFSLRREVKENKEKINNLEKFVFQSNIMQMQHTSNNVVTQFVQPIDSNDKEKFDKEEEQQEEEAKKKINNTRPRLDREKFTKFLLKKYLEQNHLSCTPVYGVKIADEISNTDPISNRPILFSAYLKDVDTELFVDIFQSRIFGLFMYYDRIYVKLSKVLNYRNAKNANAKMLCLIGKPDSEEKAGDSKLEPYFLPAISNKLLDIVSIPYTQEEYDSYII